MHYPTHWYLAGFLALVLHFFLWVGVTFLIPFLTPKPDMTDAAAIQLEDVPGGTDDSDGPEASPEEQPAPEPEPAPVTPQEEETPDEDLTDEETTPLVAENEEEAIEEIQKEVKENPSKAISGGVRSIKSGSGGQMAYAAEVIRDFYPPRDIVKYKGRVTVFATIGKDGNVKRTRMAVSSGNRAVDEIAMSAARQWKFRPALDGNGKPMENTMIISIPFNKENILRQRDILKARSARHGVKMEEGNDDIY